MKIKLIPVLVIILLSCSSKEEHIDHSKWESSTDTIRSSNTIQKNEPMSWKGLINNKIPVTIHYTIDDTLLVGEINYTKKNIPIRLIGTIESDHTYRLLEYDSIGDITGIIIGTPSNSTFKGSWYSPKSGKEYEIQLQEYDSTINYANKAIRQEVYGNYRYSYGNFHTQGELYINKVNDSLISFRILSTGNGEAPNIAEVEEDTIVLNGESFIYNIPDSDDCEFKVTFYKDFAYIKYTKGYCMGQFGLNTSIDGVFIKNK